MRAMWTLFEPVHAVTYFAPESVAAYEEAGLRGYWRGYFAGRAAPLGPVDAPVVTAAFYVFSPAVTGRALPDVWRRMAPELALRTRQAGAVAGLARVTADLPAERVAEAADLLATAARALDPCGRVLGAANLALPWPDEPLARLWQAATILREHRGDGHFAALLAEGFGPGETVVFRTARDEPGNTPQLGRGWTEEDLDAARRRLVDRGWLDERNVTTGAGEAAYAHAEAVTDRLAGAVWRELGAAYTTRLGELLMPIALACHTVVPSSNPIGLPAPVLPSP